MKTIKDIRDNLNKALEASDTLDAQPEPSTWDASKLKVGDWYYHIGSDGVAYNTPYKNDEFDKHRLKVNNIFETLEAARYHLDMIDLAWEIERQAFEPDWGDRNQTKYYLYFDHSEKTLEDGRRYVYSSGSLYFETKEKATNAFKGVSNEDFLYMQRKGLI